MTHCPQCGKEIESYYESSHKEPFIHNSPFYGLIMYSAYSVEKEVVCQSKEYVHFIIGKTEHRLIKLGCKEDYIPDLKFEPTIIEDYVYDEDCPF